MSNQKEIQDAFTLLGLDYKDIKLIPASEALWQKIKKAYKQKALEFHPDKNPAADATALFQQISKAYTDLQIAFNDGILIDLLTKKEAVFPGSSKKDAAQAANVIRLNLSDAMKNSLYAYYKDRFGPLEKAKEEQGYETIRTMLSDILGISAFAFSLKAKQDNTGYDICSEKQEIITTIDDFLHTITDYHVDRLKKASYGYVISLDEAQKLCNTKSNPINPDAVTLKIKKLMKLENTATLFSSYDEATQQYHIWVQTDDLTNIPNALGKPIAIPVQDSESSKERALMENKVLSKKPAPIQLAFVLDVTASMTSMLQAAKKSLKNIGTSIQESTKESPQMSVITYHDYEDEGKDLSVRGARGDRGAVRGREEDRFAAIEETPSAEADEKPAPKLQEALNYPGKRTEAKQPIFAKATTVANMLGAVQAEGGGDIPEMLEAALAVATQLPWNAPVRSMYVALDAPPHNHYGEKSKGDHFATSKKILEQQDKLVHDPCLKNATHPEDWITQVLMLARNGVKINPIICSKEKDVLFLATFMSCITGGSATLVNNQEWETELQPIIEEHTALDYYEAGLANHEALVLAQPISEKRKKMQPGAEYYAAVIRILNQINLNDIFSDQVDITELAKDLRSKYETEISKFLSTPQHAAKPAAQADELLLNNIRRNVVANRKTHHTAVAHIEYHEAVAHSEKYDGEETLDKNQATVATQDKKKQLDSPETQKIAKLLSFCTPYLTHLQQEIVKNNPKEKFDFTQPLSLENNHDVVDILTRRKYNSVQNLIKILNNSGQQDEQKLSLFASAYKINKLLIETRRDHAGITFLKGVATVISFGIAALLGIWNVKGKDLTQQIDSSIGIEKDKYNSHTM